MAAVIITKINAVLLKDNDFIDIDHWPLDKSHAIAIIIRISPIRFVNTVNIPALSDFLFW